MRPLRITSFALSLFQALSTVVGFVTLLLMPWAYAPMLDRTAFRGQYVLAASLLGLVVGGAQWAALYLHLRHSRWLALGYTIAGTVMLGWIAGECLAMNMFIWPHALWGGVGAIQLVLVTVLLGVLRPRGVQPTKVDPEPSRGMGPWLLKRSSTPFRQC